MKSKLTNIKDKIPLAIDKVVTPNTLRATMGCKPIRPK
jgi:hypothetical protein